MTGGSVPVHDTRSQRSNHRLNSTNMQAKTSAIIFQIIVVVLSSPLYATGEWRRTEWQNEKAWASVSNGWTAVVSEDRARLVALTPPDGEGNLLFAELKNQFSWGGHRFWLGPQGSWKAVWPPPRDWETSAAEKIEVEGGLLRVVHPQTDRNYPQIVRSYEWRMGVLHCTASWRDGRYQGIHVIQIPTISVVHVERVVSKRLPKGYVLLPIYGRDGTLTGDDAPSAVATINGSHVQLRYGSTLEKIGFPPQDLVAEIGDYHLRLRRGKMVGMSTNCPDFGMLTQVFLGSNESAFIEIEQLTPLGGDETAVSEILLEPTKKPLAKE